MIQFHEIYVRIHSISLHNDLFDESPLNDEFDKRNDQGKGKFSMVEELELYETRYEDFC